MEPLELCPCLVMVVDCAFVAEFDSLVVPEVLHFLDLSRKKFGAKYPSEDRNGLLNLHLVCHNDIGCCEPNAFRIVWNDESIVT